MAWFNKNEENDTSRSSYIPFPMNTNCDENNYLERNNWVMFCMYNPSDSSRIVSWYKLCSDYYKAVQDDDSVIFYDNMQHSTRRMPAKMARFETEEEWRQEFSRRLCVAMEHRGMTQKALVEITGISQSALSYYMSGKKLPSGYMIGQLSEALNCSADFLTMRV